MVKFSRDVVTVGNSVVDHIKKCEQYEAVFDDETRKISAKQLFVIICYVYLYLSKCIFSE